MVRFFLFNYPHVFCLCEAGRLDIPGPGGGNDRRDLVAHLEFLDQVLDVIIHGSLAEAENLRDFIRRFALGGQLHHFQFARRQMRLSGQRGLGQRLSEQIRHVTGDVKQAAKMLVKLNRIDRPIASDQAEGATDTELFAMK